MKREKIKFGMLLVFGIFLIGLVNAQYASSNVQFIAPGANSFNYNYGTNVGFPYFDQEMCQAGQDFIIQVAPFGCEPSVVRSDLLAEQNVPVFCQLSATKINPLIDVKTIDYISFQGNYPKEISGVGFHPANAAIKTSRSTLLNSPVLNNIGYAVIVLKQQKNESAIPEWVEGTLTASIRYDIKNAFGIGRASYYLPEITDDEWTAQMNQYEFWNGKGFLRAKGIDANSATVSVYQDEFHKIADFTLQKGQTSAMTYIPGYYCMAGVQVRLDSVENPDTMAKLKINDEIVEVVKGEQFLDNKCELKSLENKGIVQSVTINCETDGGRENFPLKISPRVTLDIDGNKKDAEVGDWLYKTNNNAKSVYLGYIGSKGDSSNLKDLYVYLVAIPEHKDKLSDDELATVARLAKDYEYKRVTGVKFFDFFANVGKAYVGGATQIIEWFKDGESFKPLDYSETLSIGGKNVKLVNFAGAVDAKISNTDFESAMKDYQSVVEKFPSEKLTADDTMTFGEIALQNQVTLANLMGQKKTMTEFCDNFKERYPKSDLPTECTNQQKISSTEISSRDVSINGIIKTISLERISEPTLDEYSTEIRVDGKIKETYTLRKNQIIYLKEEGEFMQLIGLDENSAKVKVNTLSSSVKEAAGKIFSSDTKTLEKNVAESLGGGYIFTLTNVNLKKVAKVSVIPNIKYTETKANFSFKIGIEKRAIQLSPEKINEKIKTLDDTISKWGNNSAKLGNIVRGLKVACISVGGWLTIKNFLTNLDGKSIARHEVMRGDGGWFDFCTNEVSKGKYTTVDACLLENNDKIEADVQTVSSVISSQAEITEKNIGTKLPEIKNKLGTLDTNVAAALSQEGYNEGKVTLTQARDLDRLSAIIASAPAGSVLANFAQKEQAKILGDIKSNAQNYARLKDAEKNAEQQGIKGMTFKPYSDKNKKSETYDGQITSQSIGSIGANEAVQGISYDNTEYYVTLKDLGNNQYRIENVYTLAGVLVADDLSNKIKGSYSYFQKYDAGSYKNPISQDDRVVRYFETEPYKGMPAIVPVDVNNGWYVEMKQTVTGNLRAYDESGRVASFYLCNVGENGKAEGIDSDDCTGFNVATGQIYTQFPGLSETETNKLVKNAITAVNQAEQSYSKGNAQGTISILGQKIQVGEPAADVPDIKCQDFMSAKDCYLLFNVCDPVICPTSRCNLGGAYNVKDVVQSGIFGSIALCAPNYREGIYIPVCLTGVKAGIDSLLSVYTNYRDCLQHSLDTGETVGICDEINSLYTCEFLWKQAAPFSKLLIPKLLSWVSGQGSRGGGEYLSVLDAWNNAGKSVDYMVQYYGVNAYKSFNARSTDEVGTEACKNFISARYPASADFFDALIEPDSPPQYSAWFQEIPFTTATVPPVSQYKVFYHIFAGKDIGAYYTVYLKSPSGSSFYYDNPTRTIATGYIAKRDYASETRDFTAPSGYTQLCISVNGQDECGFKQVSTDFSVNYVKEKYVQEQTQKTDINSEKECISGSASWYGFANPNLEAGAQQAINPELSSIGIVRVCATENPGKATDPSWNGNNSRWKSVGNCGNENLKCWLDTDSVEQIIKNTNIENEILGEVTSDYLNNLKSQGYLNLDDEKENLKKLSSQEKTKAITEDYISKFFFNNERAYLLLTRGNAFAELAEVAYNKIKEGTTTLKDKEGLVGINTKRDKLENAGVDVEGLTDEEVEEKYEGRFGKQIEFLEEGGYPILEFKDGKYGEDLYYTYFDNEWKWSNDNKKTWYNVNLNLMTTFEPFQDFGGDFTPSYDKRSDKDKDLIKSLRGESYEEGVKLLISRTLENDEGGWLTNAELSTDSVDLSHEGIFTVKQKATTTIYFKFENSKWKWSHDNNKWSVVPNFEIEAGRWVGEQTKNLNLINALTGKNLYEGAGIIFSVDKVELGGAGGLEDRKNVNYDFKIRSRADIIKVITYAKDNSLVNRKCLCGEDCSSYAKFIVDSSESNGIPDPLLLLSLMIQESSCKDADKCNAEGYCGLMQVGEDNSGWENPKTNIEIGARILKSKYNYDKGGKIFQGCSERNVKYYNWEAAVRGYNGWGCNPNYPEQDFFVDEVIERYVKLVKISNSNKEPISSSTGETKWTLDSALEEVKTRTGKYSDNKVFIDGLYRDEILTKDEYNEIIGYGRFDTEEYMFYVKNLLEKKLLESKK